jgi:hypothetical protein
MNFALCFFPFISDDQGLGRMTVRLSESHGYSSAHLSPFHGERHIVRREPSSDSALAHRAVGQVVADAASARPEYFCDSDSAAAWLGSFYLIAPSSLRRPPGRALFTKAVSFPDAAAPSQRTVISLCTRRLW